MSRLVRMLLLVAAFGAGTVFALAAVAGGWYWYQSRPPRPWNAGGITAEFDSADVEGNENTLVFSYVVQNHTGRDFRISDGNGVTVAGRRERRGDLTFGSGSTIRVDYPVLVPPQDRARVAIHLAYPCPALQLEPDVTKENRNSNLARVNACIATEFENLAGFVLFDERDRIRIDFPKPQL
jgi:hypothetical protein